MASLDGRQEEGSSRSGGVTPLHGESGYSGQSASTDRGGRARRLREVPFRRCAYGDHHDVRDLQPIPAKHRTCPTYPMNGVTRQTYGLGESCRPVRPLVDSSEIWHRGRRSGSGAPLDDRNHPRRTPKREACVLFHGAARPASPSLSWRPTLWSISNGSLSLPLSPLRPGGFAAPLPRPTVSIRVSLKLALLCSPIRDGP